MNQQTIIKHLEKYQAQKVTAQAQLHMIEGAIQALEILLKEVQDAQLSIQKEDS